VKAHRSRCAVAGLLLALLAGACGSNIPPTDTATADGGVGGATVANGGTGGGATAASESGSGAVPGSGSGPAVATGIRAATNSGDGVAAGGPGAAVPAAGRTPGAPTATPAAAAAGTSASAKREIQIGLPDPQGGPNTVGVKGVGTGAIAFTGRAEYEVLVDDLNARGGINGAKVVPVWYPIDPTAPASTQEQATCTLLTQDHHVFAAVVPQTHSPQILACFEKAGVVTIQHPGYTTGDDVVFAQNRHYLTGGNVNLTRVATVEIDALVAQGFLDKSSKIGLVRWDTPAHTRAANNALKPALARHGLKLTEEVATSPTYSVADAGVAARENQNAVLRMRTAGVDRVLFLGIGGSPGFFFVTAAQSQGYYPRYGLSSNDMPDSLRQQADPRAFEGAVGVGWWPLADVSAGEQPPLSADGARCKALLESKGQRAALDGCDTINVFAKAATAAGGSLNRDTFMTALEGLGEWEPATMLRVHYGKDRHDGVSMARYLKFVDACTCMRYTSPAFPI
jgi:hypothetical protein